MNELETKEKTNLKENEDAEAIQSWPREDSFDAEPYLGEDITDVQEVAIPYTEEQKNDPNVEMANNWLEKLTHSDINRDQQINLGVEIAKAVSDDLDRYYGWTQMTLAGRQVLLGKILNTLKRLTREAGYMWQKWADTHLRFLKPRSRERAMLLASREDCHPYIALGAERLEQLCQVTKGSKEQNPIGALLDKYSILSVQDPDVTPAEFKILVDAALKSEKLQQNGISVNFDIVRQLTQRKVEVDSTLITRLQETRASGESEERYLERLALSGGKALLDSDPEKPFRDFNSLSSRLLDALAQVLKDETRFDKIDAIVLSRLVGQLQSLQSKLVQSAESQAA
jgi:hypothetical protein